ncbi:hypothetical protein KCP91_15320 [Microvirga sp. SRT01]|jgi:hypothetical protein|uniref:Uncharacterized protein n=1 Tax=Sphingomonas longa TaxID=2778730 RepID=A0ABS2D9X6_9SPHN|nr:MULTISPECIES: hypothetical protein [Alphaproteobacteria]MBM6577752.1 hypothetical protein [Sphingomonas sp. BT552]MBR7710794.1 hypothetical protein [Microvirga sp. SRT01]
MIWIIVCETTLRLRSPMTSTELHDIAKLRSLRGTLGEMQQPQRSAGSEEAINNCQGEISKIEADWPDDRLVAAFNGTEKRVGEPEADALLAEIKHRGLSL